MKILIVEDEPFNITVLEEMIYIFYPDMEIKSAENGKLGYEILQNESFDLILSDISMPVMDGYEFIAKVKNELQLQIPAIAVTAFAITGDKEKILLAGFDDYLSKPIDMALLEEMLQKYQV